MTEPAAAPQDHDPSGTRTLPVSACDPWRLNIDLHCHSVISDGTLAPREVVRRAARNGVQLLALTDHDEVAGLAEAADEAQQIGLPFIPGVEISVSWADETIHIVGLRIDPADSGLLAGLASVREGRDARARQIGEGLARAGFAGAYEGAQRFAGNPNLVSRSHFARYLVEIGARPNMKAVFSDYLVRGKPGYVPHRWARLADAVGWIRGAGGIAVMAHPARYRLSETALWALVDEFRACGGRGIEVLSGSHSQADAQRFARWSREFGLAASRASDFHDPDESHYDLGCLPLLPDSVEPIWAGWPEIQALRPHLETA